MKLEIDEVSKQYRKGVLALRGFSIELKPGVLGLLGPNGAGKTTLMSILATITKASKGRVLWDGVDIAKKPDALRSVLGYLPQDFGVYPNLNAVEFLEYLAAVKGLDAATSKRRIEELLDLVNLTDARKRPLGGFSGGMKQRVGIAQALLNDPQLLIVDEPTAGLDPISSGEIDDLILKLQRERQMASIVVTHDLHSARTIANRLALLDLGNVVIEGSFEDLQESGIEFVKDFLKLS